jgi:rod shape determining protein RodA
MVMRISLRTASSLMNRFRSVDWILVLAMFTLLVLGLAAIYSVELSQDAGGFINMKKQLFAIGVGLCLFFFVAVSNYQLFRNYSLVLYVLGVTLLIAVLVFGRSIRGSTGWFDFGFVSFQPVEFMKVALIIALATYFSSQARRPLRLKELLISGAIAFIPVFLVLLQPDLGSALILVGIWFFMALFAGMRVRHVLALGLCGIVTMFLSWFFFLAEYQKARLVTFWDPTYDVLGQGYNVAQAIIAIGSGGLIGSGLGFGTQSHLKFLPESQTDFIFAVIAEELGFVGVSLLLFAFALLFYRHMKLVSYAKDDFTGLLILGITCVFFLQFLVNIGMNLGLFPVTGIGLPFVSYGGSSMIFLLLLASIIQSIAVRQR